MSSHGMQLSNQYDPPKQPEKGPPETRLTREEAAWWREQQDRLNGVGRKKRR